MTGEPADPYDLPRQRRGTTPQMHGRYPDFDVLDNAPHWDEPTRRVVLGRVHDVPPIRFLGPREVATVAAFADVATAQDGEPRIPLENFIDEKLHLGNGEGYQYDDMPDDREVWRLVAQGLDEQAQARSAGAAVTFAQAGDELRHEIVGDFAQGRLRDGVWERLNVERAFGVVMHDVLVSFYSHPWAWSEIGFGGPAYPRGYARFGTPHLQPAEREPWEGREAYDRDPVSGRREPPPR